MKASYAKMEKAILLNLKSEQVADILNEKTGLRKKQYPKNFTGWVYIYVRKAKPYITQQSSSQFTIRESKDFTNLINGKVIARFWFDEDYVFLDEQGYYNWFITLLEIFDEPKELSEFYIYANFSEATWRTLNYEGFKDWAFIKKAPPNWKSVYVESEIKE